MIKGIKNFFHLVKSNPLIKSCIYCNSLRLDIIVQKVEDGELYAKCRCESCGAIAEIKETWVK